MKINKFSLLWAIKKSASVTEVAQRLGRPSEDEEKIWNKMLRYYPEAENFLSRNEDIRDMQEAYAREDWAILKEARLDFLITTGRLIKSGLIAKKDIQDIVAKLKNKRNKRVDIPASKEKDTFEEESQEEPQNIDAVEITSVVPEDLAKEIILK